MKMHLKPWAQCSAHDKHEIHGHLLVIIIIIIIIIVQSVTEAGFIVNGCTVLAL